ncbi:hypothetical protein EJ05DRAFT_486052 [Pseudovirgaria hyperparasitica]|uniref:Clustered mitochondria protein homolog n=1 Tax=Pseudovirgaria hyperparasitica TaxID=470096 RepID=A0A6A6W7I4_9PEZI|nr:uncharacterized protein EJ05DRAFT_486052 [Pseudovirgaria hyperparasitica]KAF2757984.1 hypothetical protein EJ05DRAFT_486052 [Pseudovirgaria hyperparasitica]
MAAIDTNDASTSQTVPASDGDSKQNGERADGDQNGDNAQNGAQEENYFEVTIHLPHKPTKIQIMLSTSEQVQDLRQTIIEQPNTLQYSCFHLEHNGTRINDFVELSEVSGLKTDPNLKLVEDPYTEKEARFHVIRIRELIGAAGDRIDSIHGVMSGLSVHDDIAQNEVLTPVTNGSADGAKLPNISAYDFNAPASLKTIIPSPRSPPPKTVKNVSVSPWNPPPYHLRSKGHLLYLQVTNNEGEQHQITAHVGGFFVNKSSSNKFDPSPRAAPKDFSAHSLLTLLSKISPSFDTSFTSLQEHNSEREMLSYLPLPNAMPANPWLVPAPTAEALAHSADITRTQETYLIAGVDNTDSLRDWNEEFQSTREMPKDTVQDRVFRERLTSKLFADYNEAATRGALLVARGEVQPLNPTEAKDAQIFVYNNIFFSFGADGVGTFTTDGGDEAARVATGKDVAGVRAVNNLDIDGLFTPGTVIVDYMGKRIVCQSIVPGIFKQREPGEHQIDYGGVEGKDIVAVHESFVPLFEKVSKALKVKKHPVWDKELVRHELEGSVETKGLIGTDARKYALDLYRITPIDVDWIEQHWSERSKEGEIQDQEKDYPHRMAVLRPELVESYGRVKLSKFVEKKRDELRNKPTEKETAPESETATETEGGQVEKKDKPEEKLQERIDISDFQFALNPDVFCGQAPQSEEDKAEWALDEAEVRSACNHLLNEVIPGLIKELQDGEVGFPMDGQSLSALLHKRGINIRYLGKLASSADKEDSRLQALKLLVVQEMIARGFKHVANRLLRNVASPCATACLAHLLNCAIGTGLNANPHAETDPSLKSIYSDADFSYEAYTPERLQTEIIKEISTRFRYNLGDSWIDSGKHLQVLREIALKMGLQLEAKDYAFAPVAKTASPELTNGHTNGTSKKKKKGGDTSSPTRASAQVGPAQTFRPDDILNVVPVIKEASPKSVLAEEALEAGRVSLASDQKELGRELLLESLSLHETIYGPLHPEVARLYHQLSNLLYTLDEKAPAVELAHKAVVVSERTLGVDHAETVLNYLNLGLFEHWSGNTKAALTYVLHALNLWKIIYGPKHPDSVTTINNAAVMLQTSKMYHESRLWFEESLAICEEVSGKQSINAATLLFQLSQALALDKDMHQAVNKMRDSYNIFNNVLGAEDRNTKEAESWLSQLTSNAVAHAKHAKDLQERKIRRVHIGGAMRPQPQVGQTSDAASNIATPGRTTGNLDQRSIEELLKYIEGDSPKKTPKKRAANPKRRAQQSTA